MDDLAVFPEPEKRPGGGNRVEIGGTSHHVTERNQDTTQTRPERQEVHSYHLTGSL